MTAPVQPVLSRLDLAVGRLRLDRLGRNPAAKLSSPVGLRPPFLANQESLAVQVLRMRFGRSPAFGRSRAAASIAHGLRIAIEAALGGLEHSERKTPMANIGSFKKSGQDYVGEIVTLSVQTKNVRITHEETRTTDNAPSHRVYVGRAEIGAAWTKRSNEGRDYLSVKLDDPSFVSAIYANLFDDEDGETCNLIWSRATKRNGD